MKSLGSLVFGLVLFPAVVSAVQLLPDDKVDTAPEVDAINRNFQDLERQIQRVEDTAAAASTTTVNTDGLIKAWVVFNGTSANPITPDASYGISGTITKHGTGSYTVTFATAFTSATSYGVAGMATNRFVEIESSGNKTASSCRIGVRGDSGALGDSTVVTVMFYGR